MIRILWHSVGLLLRSPGMALRVSVGPLLILMLLLRALDVLVSGTGPFDGATMLLTGVVQAFFAAWTAVAWHRYVLRGEAATGLLPPFAEHETYLYMGWSFLLGLTFTLIVWAAGPLLWTVLDPLGGLGWPGLIAGLMAPVLVMAYLGFRFGLVLPAAAAGRPIDLFESWASTRRLSGAIWGLAALAALWAAMLTLSGAWLVRLPEAAVVVVMATLGWLSLMLGLSVLTTLYGHLVERRPLG